MSVPLTILIGNTEYNVIGESEDLIREASYILNQKILEFSDKNSDYDKIPLLTKTTLAALNIAESKLKANKNFIKKHTEIIDEINKITDFIELNINNPHYS